MDTWREVLALRKDYRYRRSFSSGLIAYGPWWQVIALALLGGLIYAAVFPSASRLVLCINHTLGGKACIDNFVSQLRWLIWLGTGSIVTGVFFQLDRICVRRDWTQRVGEYMRLTFAHLWSTISVPIATVVFALQVDTSLSHLIGTTLIVSAVHLRLVKTARGLSHWMMSRMTEPCLSWFMRDHLCQRYRLRFVCVEVNVSNRRIEIKGPFDAIEVGQIRYMVETDLRAWIDTAAVYTTLDSKTYDESLTNPLQPSGLVDRDTPIPQVREVSFITLLLILVLGFAFLGYVLKVGGILSWDDFGALVEEALIGMGHR